jgi:ABC-type molybdate transport system substrate-binding protein
VKVLRTIAVLAGLLLPQLSPAQAAELKVLESNALKSVMDELGPQFEKASGNKLVQIVGTTAELRGMIEKGAAFDVAVFTKSALDDLAKQGKIADAPRTAIARTGIGVGVKRRGKARRQYDDGFQEHDVERGVDWLCQADPDRGQHESHL